MKLKWKLKTLLQVGDSPDFILLHCGGNDLGLASLHVLRYCINDTIQIITEAFSNVKIIRSEILPRDQWRYSSNSKATNKARNRLNNYAASRVCAVGGYYVSTMICVLLIMLCIYLMVCI